MAIKLAFFNRNLQHLLNKWTCEAFSLSLSIHAAGKGWRKINLFGFKDWTEMIHRLTWNQYDDDPMDWMKNFICTKACWNSRTNSNNINSLSWMDTFRFHNLSTSMDAENTMKIHKNAWEVKFASMLSSYLRECWLGSPKFQPHHRVPGLILTRTWLHIHNFQPLTFGKSHLSKKMV